MAVNRQCGNLVEADKAPGARAGEQNLHSPSFAVANGPAAQAIGCAV